MTTKIFLVRHAEAEGNLFRVAHGQYDSVITPQGYRQLAYLRERFREEQLDAVYGSDLTRTHTTASALYVPRNLPLCPPGAGIPTSAPAAGDQAGRLGAAELGPDPAYG